MSLSALWFVFQTVFLCSPGCSWTWSILLLQPPQYSDNKCVPPHPASSFLINDLHHHYLLLLLAPFLSALRTAIRSTSPYWLNFKVPFLACSVVLNWNVLFAVMFTSHLFLVKASNLNPLLVLNNSTSEVLDSSTPSWGTCGDVGTTDWQSASSVVHVLLGERLEASLLQNILQYVCGPGLLGVSYQTEAIPL